MEQSNPDMHRYEEHLPRSVKVIAAIALCAVFVLSAVGVNMGLWINKSLEASAEAGTENRKIEADREAKALEIVFEMVRKGMASPAGYSEEQRAQVVKIAADVDALRGQVNRLDGRLRDMERWRVQHSKVPGP